MRTGTALCLSGGGFRSALFHLGALRRLRELRVLHDVSLISSVSGGSILAGFFADVLARSGVTESRDELTRWLDDVDWETVVAAPFRRITASDFRTVPVLAHLLWNWARPGLRVRSLERRYQRRISKLTLGQIPHYPRFVFCATNLTFGVNWEFSRERSGDYQAGYVTESLDWPLARAMAASSCFPPVFGPMPVRVAPRRFKQGRYRGDDRDELLRKTALTDGGVYDNLGLEPAWKDYDTVLVSDCGAPFGFSYGKTPFRRLLRYTSVVMNQASSARKRMFFQGRYRGRYAGTYWGIRSAAGREAPDEDEPESAQAEKDGFGGYSTELVDRFIAEIRTDLDAFTEPEQKVLENHGYFAANRSLLRHLDREGMRAVKLEPPHPAWLDETKVQEALRKSSRRVSATRALRLFKDRLARSR